MEKRNDPEEKTLRVIAIAFAGWMLLLAMVPAWAREAVLGFGAFYAVLVGVLDESVREMIANWIPGHRRERGARDDPTSVAAKRPAARRAAT